jgi:hypothetical protein
MVVGLGRRRWQFFKAVQIQMRRAKDTTRAVAMIVRRAQLEGRSGVSVDGSMLIVDYLMAVVVGRPRDRS